MKIKDLYIELSKEGKKNNINELDIRFLISTYLGLNDCSSFYLSLNKEIIDISKIKENFEKLKQGIPISYILNKTLFLGHSYFVDKNTLIPRMETEELVLKVSKYIEIYLLDKYPLSILDIGCGSGIIGIELKNRFIESKVDMIDISPSIINVSKQNIDEYKLDINTYIGDTFPNNNKKYNVIISNPPYIKNIDEIDDSVIKYEPKTALLLTDENNLYFKILSNLDNKISFPTIISFEIDPSLKDELINYMNKYLSKYNFNFIFSNDINNKLRFLTIIISNENIN